ELFPATYSCAPPPARPLAAGKRPPTLREICEHPLIGYRTCRATELVVDQLRTTGVEPHFVFRSNENGVVQGLAATGVGVALVPRLAVDENDETVRVVELGPKIAPRIVGIARHRDRYHSAAAGAFVATALDVGRETAAAIAA